jgi:hypothetical protein
VAMSVSAKVCTNCRRWLNSDPLWWVSPIES